MEAPLSIFYLNNNHDDLGCFKSVAQKLGNTVLVFKKGQEMLQALNNSSKKPDVIFLDTEMPIVNGEEILDVLKKSREWRNIPIVMVSGAFPKKLARHFLQMGANYLVKKHHNSNYEIQVEQVLTTDLHSPKVISELQVL